MPSAAAAPSAMLLYTKSGIVFMLVLVLVLGPGPGLFPFPCCPLRLIFAFATCALECALPHHRVADVRRVTGRRGGDLRTTAGQRCLWGESICTAGM
ncbi:hypothetical protein B0H13DRAFT_2091949 [Mycena leptocephala]|nr:hypothetical protein B0H13DRAFT_2091949 [Mycena leptocephala]